MFLYRFFLTLILLLITSSSYALYSREYALELCATQQGISQRQFPDRVYQCTDNGLTVTFDTHTLGSISLSSFHTSQPSISIPSGSYSYLLQCFPPRYYNDFLPQNVFCSLGQQCPDGSVIPLEESCTRTCPDGTQVSTYQSCPLHLCPDGSFKEDPDECGKRHCEIPENPITADCQYPNNQGLPEDCIEGGNEVTAGFYAFPAANQSCPTLWDGFWAEEGKTQTCGDGSTQTWPNSCFNAALDKTVADLLSNPWVIGGIALTMGNPLRVFSIFTTAQGFQRVSMTLPLAVRTSALADASSAIRYSSAEITLPNNTLGLAIKEYIASNPGSSLEQALIQKFPLGVAKEAITINPLTGEIIPASTSLPLSNTQTAATALASGALTTAELQAISPYLRLNTIPWLTAAADAIEGDFWRVYDDKYNEKQPVNFPGTANKPLATTIPLALENPNPAAELGPESPQSYDRPKPTVTTTPGDKPTSLDDPGTVTGVPDPVGPINPNDPVSTENLPTPPELHPDYWKYLDWLPIDNPYTWTPGDYIPTLPESGCTYEVHTSFNTHFFGVKHIDLAPCQPLQPLRDVLAWVFSVLTGFICFNVIFRTTA